MILTFPSVVLYSKAVGKVRDGHATFCILRPAILPCPWESFGHGNHLGGEEWRGRRLLCNLRSMMPLELPDWCPAAWSDAL